jgi:hypothetical protein
MQRLIFSFLLVYCILPFHAEAQRILLDENVDTVRAIPRIGPNRLFYAYPVIKAGLIAPPYEKGAKTNFWSSSVSYEIRNKLKLWSWNALVFDFGYRCDRFLLNQDDTSQLPTYSGRHKRERISTHNLSLSLCDRINFGRRGNIQGIYVDFGVYGDYVMRAAHFYVDEHYDSNSPVAGHTKIKVKNTQLQFINRWNYGATARFGWEWGSAFVMYRLSDLVKDNVPSVNYPELPRLSVGMEMYFVAY